MRMLEKLLKIGKLELFIDHKWNYTQALVEKL
jgi:hypothetical protein